MGPGSQQAHQSNGGLWLPQAAEAAIARLPRFAHAAGQGSDELECVICMDGIGAGDTVGHTRALAHESLPAHTLVRQVLVLPCLHRLHASCGTRWLRLNPSCPMCKQKL